MSFTTSGQVAPGDGGYASVSNFSLSSSASSAGAQSFPYSVSLTPTTVSASGGGAAGTYTFDPAFRVAWQDLAAEVDEGRATASGPAGPGAAYSRSSGAAGGAVDFKTLPLEGRLDLLRARGFTVEPLGNGKYKLRMSGKPTVGATTGLSVPTAGTASMRRAEPTEVTAVYDANSNSIEEVDIHVDSVHRSHSTLSSGTITATADVALDGNRTRTARFSASLAQ